MQTMLVMMQLTSALDRHLSKVTRSAGLTAHDALILGCLADRPGIPASQVASKASRSRQNLQRSLERLEERGFVERCESCIRKRAAGWALTETGQGLWAEIGRGFASQERELTHRGLVTRNYLDAVKHLTFELLKPKAYDWSTTGLLDIPQPEKIPDWDL